MMDPFQVAAKTGFKGIEFHFTYAWPANGAWPGCRPVGGIPRFHRPGH